MKTWSAKPADIRKDWTVIDATGLVVGRLAAIVAPRLRGKHKPGYTPHMDCGDHIIIVNADKVVFTGRKLIDKQYYKHTGYPGGIRSTTPERILGGKHPTRVIEKAIERMMPDGPLASQQMRNLRIYAGAEHPHQAQSPVPFDVATLNSKNARAV
ncbi:MAG: 50S ribosomal protein L13 [Parvularculales bacterium]